MKKVLKFFIILMVLVIVVVLYARYIGTYGFITKEYTLYNNNLPDDFDGLKVVHFSDIHYGRAISSKKINDIVDEINIINPDIVVFTGDLIDKDAVLKDKDFNFLTSAFSKISAKYGKYAVLGNHDYLEISEVINVFNNSGFKHLENSYDIIYSKNNNTIFIGGLEKDNYTLDINADIYNNLNYKIFLVHEPDKSDMIVSDYNPSLILAGHSHNGQVKLPGIGALYTPNGAKKYYDEYYNINNSHLYISSGVGVSIASYRLFNRPSINFYRINKSK